MGGHDTVWRVDRQGEVLMIWCRKCSGYARQMMGPKLMDCCKPERNGGTRIWNFEIRILVLEEEKVPAKNARGWKVEGLKRRITREEDQRLR